MTEYLLKPVTVQQLQPGVAAAGAAARPRAQRAGSRPGPAPASGRRVALRSSKDSGSSSLVGAISLPDAIEQSELLSLDLIARCYLVVVIRIAPRNPGASFDYAEFQRAQDIVSDIVGNDPDVSVLRKDLEELVLIVKGDTPEYLVEARDVLLRHIQRACEPDSVPADHRAGRAARPHHRSWPVVYRSTGRRRERRSRAARRARRRRDCRRMAQDRQIGARRLFEMWRLRRSSTSSSTASSCHSAPRCQSTIVKNYILLDIVFTTARLIKQWGGEPDQVLPELHQLEAILANVNTIEEIKDHASADFEPRAGVPRWPGERAARRRHPAGPRVHSRALHGSGISLHVVASRVGHSPSHFCTVFGEATGADVQGLPDRAAHQARQRTAAHDGPAHRRDLAQVGYNDPHYFSLVFRKTTGLSPRSFGCRAQTIRDRAPR